MTPPRVRIHYLRPPDHTKLHEQWLVHDDADVKVSFARRLDFDRTMSIGGRVALEDGSDVVWFTFPGAWHDIGRFHDAGGRFTGLYANILTPPVFEPGHVWRTTDLFLDVWLPPGGPLRVLDREEFDEAVERGWVEPSTARRALEEVERIRGAAERGEWPPAVVEEWTRERALGVLEAG